MFFKHNPSTESENKTVNTMRSNPNLCADCVQTHTIQNTTKDEVSQFSVFQMTPKHYT